MNLAPCPRCQGSGREPSLLTTVTDPCRACGGRGDVVTMSSGFTVRPWPVPEKGTTRTRWD